MADETPLDTSPIDETLANLRANPETAAAVKFPALGWTVVMHADDEEPDKYHVRIHDMHGEIRVDETMDACTIKKRMRTSAALDKRRGILMGAVLTAEAEKFLASL